MRNYEIMNIELKRVEVLDLKLSLLALINDMKKEYVNEDTTECRKKVLSRSIAKWENLKNNIDDQFNKQDN